MLSMLSLPQLKPSGTTATANDRFLGLWTHHHTLGGFLPLVSSTFNHISRVLSKHNIKPVDVLPRKLSSFLRPFKDHLARCLSDVQLSIFARDAVYASCFQGKLYIGQTASSTERRVKEQHRHIRLDHPEKSAVAEHTVTCQCEVSLTTQQRKRVGCYFRGYEWHISIYIKANVCLYVQD
jgi:hypothetical protein